MAVTIAVTNKVHHKTCQTSVIPPVCNLKQNKAISDDDDGVSIFNCADTNISEVESSDSNNEKSDRRSSIADSERIPDASG